MDGLITQLADAGGHTEDAVFLLSRESPKRSLVYNEYV